MPREISCPDCFFNENISECPNCKDGKITVYTQEELDKAVEAERDTIESIICDIDIDVIGYALSPKAYRMIKAIRARGERE